MAGEVIVVLRFVRLHVKLGQLGPASEIDGERRTVVLAPASLGQQERHGGGPRGVALESLAHGRSELLGSVVVQEAQKLADLPYPKLRDAVERPAL